MHGLPPDFFQEDFVAEAFHEGYLALWGAIEAEGLSPEQLISRWTTRKRTTIYDWRKSGKVPDTPDLWRLIHASSQKGFPQLARTVVAPLFAFVSNREVVTNGSFVDEICDIAEVAGTLSRLEKNGGSERALVCADDLDMISHRVRAEAQRRQPRIAKAKTG